MILSTASKCRAMMLGGRASAVDRCPHDFGGHSVQVNRCNHSSSHAAFRRTRCSASCSGHAQAPSPPTPHRLPLEELPRVEDLLPVCNRPEELESGVSRCAPCPDPDLRAPRDVVVDRHVRVLQHDLLGIEVVTGEVPRCGRVSTSTGAEPHRGRNSRGPERGADRYRPDSLPRSCRGWL